MSLNEVSQPFCSEWNILPAEQDPHTRRACPALERQEEARPLAITLIPAAHTGINRGRADPDAERRSSRSIVLASSRLYPPGQQVGRSHPTQWQPPRDATATAI
jgi:hypothetical protein